MARPRRSRWPIDGILWHNLGQAVERAVARHRTALRPDRAPQPRATTAPVPSPMPPQVPTALPMSSPGAPEERTDRVAERTRARYRAIHDLLDQGMGIRAIATRLSLSRGTVRRFARAEKPEQLLVNNGTGYRTSLLEPYKPYLHRRWAAGATNATHLAAEITARGYTGGFTVVRDYIRRLRAAAPQQIPPTSPAPPTVRQVTSWLMTDPATLDTTSAMYLQAILDRSPTLAALAEHIRRFAHMMRHLAGDRLRDWMASARRTAITELRSFVAGLERDYDAVAAGLTLPHSSGPVEGHVNRIKMLKRQMFGRANLDLLRIRVLHST